MSSVASLEVLVGLFQTRLAQAEERLKEAAGHQRIKCCSCDKYTEVREIEVIAEYWFKENVGCPAGTGRTHFRGHHYVCPKCDWPNKKNTRFNEIATKYIHSFKKVTDEQH